jgi:hypothetical protein
MSGHGQIVAFAVQITHGSVEVKYRALVGTTHLSHFLSISYSKMVTTVPPVRYEDPEVQKAHTDLYLNSSDRPLYPVLPPGINQEDFDKAIHELVEALGSKNVFAGEALQDYIDPYEIDEPGVERKIPGAAVWLEA